jgi:hypothetical protein
VVTGSESRSGRQLTLRAALVACALVSYAGTIATPARAADDAVGITAPAPLGSLEVPYPENARGDATVELELVVGADGAVVSALVTSGDPPFAEAARVGAESFRFTPATKNGIAVRARIRLRIGFRAPAPPAPEPPAAGVAPATTPPGSALPGADATPSAAASTSPTEPLEVIVLGEQRADLGSIHIPKEEARRVPGAFGDPFRVVEALPGVAPILSGLPYFFVRGASPGSVGYFVDGIRVPLLFHVGPGPSVVAPILIERVDLHPGAYPARFGRYAGAILAGETTAPSDHSRAEAQARIFDASAVVEQPFAEGRGSAVLGGRYSYTQAILAAVAPDYELGYGDYQARLSYAVTPRDRLTAFAFGGFDYLGNNLRDATLFDVEFHRVDLRWDHGWTDGRLRTAVTLASDRILTTPDDDGAPGSVQRSRGVRLRSELDQALGDAARVRVGGDIEVARLGAEREQIDDVSVDYAARTDVTTGLYADVSLRPRVGVEIVPGARLDFARTRGGETRTFFEPRLSTRTRLARGLMHLGGFGMAHQLPATSIRVPASRPTLLESSVQSSTQAMQGLEYALPSSMLGRTTVFLNDTDIEGEGIHGRSFGLEQFLRRDFTKKLGGFLSYTLSRAEGLVGREEVLSSHDRTHVLSAVLGYDFGAGFRLGVRGYVASGKARSVACPTPDCGPGDGSLPRPYVRDLRLPAFSRVDFRFEKKFRFQSGFWITGTLEWFNALLAEEVDTIYWEPAVGLVEDRQSALTLPSIGVELGW